MTNRANDDASDHPMDLPGSDRVDSPSRASSSLVVLKRASRCDEARLPTLVTWLKPTERASVDAAGFGRFTTIHRDSISAARKDLKLRRADAVLISVARLERESDNGIASLVDGFAVLPVLGLVLHVNEERAVAGAAVLGQLGVSRVIDGRFCTGWSELREALEASTVFERVRPLALAAIRTELEAVSAGGVRFFSEVFAPHVFQAAELARRLNISPSTLTSRFVRADLPTPKTYVRLARLVRAAFLGEARGLSCTDVAHQMHASSPQSLARTVKQVMGLSFVEFRYRFRGHAMLQRFIGELITPYRATLQRFDPVHPVRHEHGASISREAAALPGTK